MSLDSNSPEIYALRLKVEDKFGKALSNPYDFVELSDVLKTIRDKNGILVGLSESTLQRVWQYRKSYKTISTNTLDVLSLYVGFNNWQSFLEFHRQTTGEQSSFQAGDYVDISNLSVGSMVRVGWLPDRMCLLKYLGENKFIVIESHNAKLMEGDTFTCYEMGKGKKMTCHNVVRSTKPMTYVAGTKNGLTELSIL